MTWLAVAGAVLQIGYLLLKRWLESDAKKREELKEVQSEFKEALKERDYARLTLAWNRAHRLR